MAYFIDLRLRWQSDLLTFQFSYSDLPFKKFFPVLRALDLSTLGFNNYFFAHNLYFSDVYERNVDQQRY